MASISTVELVAAYPEWANAATGALDQAVAIANAMDLTHYTVEVKEKQRRFLEACSFLYQHPFGRDMFKSAEGFAPQDPYRAQAYRMDRLKGAATRAPGWEMLEGWP
jgi:hypothetical protein